jgi:hypothetical protein
MTPTFSILVKSLVRQFYRQNAGQLIFVFILFIGAVGELEGQLKYTGPLFQFHYQYALILGMLSNRMLFALVFFAWLLYAEKCAQFVLGSLQQQDHSFAYLLNELPAKKMFGLLYRVQLLLFLPIGLYSLAILGVAIYKGWWLSGLIVIGYILAINLLTAARYQYQLQHPGKSSLILLPRLFSAGPGPLIQMGFKTLVKPFYRQNAALFLFLFLLFFGVVAPSMQLDYHYALIRGVLASPIALGVVLFVWLLYVLKCINWVTAILGSPDHSFLNLLSQLDNRRRFLLLLGVQIILCLPISSYALAITGVALYKGYPITAMAVQLYILFLCLAGAWRYQYRLEHPGSNPGRWTRWMRVPALAGRKGKPLPYWSFFIRYLFQDGKALLLGLKLAGCAVLYLLLKDRAPDYYDIRMPFLLYTMVLFGHGVLIYRCRTMEEKMLSFYRGLPVSLGQRWVQYCLLYFLVLMPEMLTLSWLTPIAIRWKDALGFMLSGYSLLLLLNSVLFVASLKMSDFLKLSLGIFGILYLGVLGDAVIVLSGGFFVVAGCLFFGGYWRYQS